MRPPRAAFKQHGACGGNRERGQYPPQAGDDSAFRGLLTKTALNDIVRRLLANNVRAAMFNLDRHVPNSKPAAQLAAYFL